VPITVHSSTPAYAVSATNPVTTASFTPPAGALLLSLSSFSTPNARTETTTTVTGSTSAWTQVQDYATGTGAGNGAVAINWATVTASQATTVRSSWSASNPMAVHVPVFEAAEVLSSGTVAATGAQTITIPATKAGTRALIVYAGYSTTSKPTAGTGLTELAWNATGLGAGVWITNDLVAGNNSFTLTVPATGMAVAWVEIGQTGVTLTNNAEGGTAGAAVATGGTGSGTAWNAVTPGVGTITYDTTYPARGTKGLKFTTGATAATPYVEWTTTATGTAVTTQHTRAYARIGALPGTIHTLKRIYSGTTAVGRVQITTAGTVRYVSDATGSAVTLGTTTWTVPTAALFRLETRVVHSATGSVEFRLFTGANVHGTTPDQTQTYTGNTGTNADRVMFGISSGNSVANYNLWLDELGWSSATWLGPAPAIAAVTYEATVLADTPVAFIVGQANGTMTDQVGGRTVTIGGNTAAAVTPHGQPARRWFNGSYAQLADDNAFSVPTTGILTIEAWLRPDVYNFPGAEPSGDGPYCHWIGKGVYGPNAVEWAGRMYSRDNSARPNRISGYAFPEAGGLGAGSYFEDVVVAGDWIHWVLIIDTVNLGGDGWGTVTIYRDGVQRDQDTLGAPYNVVPANTTAPLRIAAAMGTYFTGAVDRVAVYNYRLPQARIAAHTAAMANPLSNAKLREAIFRFVSTVENGNQQWWTHFGYIEFGAGIDDFRGYTGGIVGWTTATFDMNVLIKHYTVIAPGNVLSKWIDELNAIDLLPTVEERRDASASTLGAPFMADFQAAADDPLFIQAQLNERDRLYWNTAYAAAVADGLSPLGLLHYYDTSVNHGQGESVVGGQSFQGCVATAKANATPPSQGGNELTYLAALNNARQTVLETWGDYQLDGRVPALRTLVTSGNLQLNTPFSWNMYGTPHTISAWPDPHVAETSVAAPAATFGSITENFTSNLGAFNQNSASVAAVSGRARIPVDATYPTLGLPKSYTLKGSQFRARVYVSAAGGGTTVSNSMGLDSTATADGSTRLNISYNAVANTLRFSNEVAWTDDAASSITYSATTHAWWGYRESGGQLYFETSADGVTWTIRKQVATPTWIGDAGDQRAYFTGYRDAGTADFFEVDDVNIVPGAGTAFTAAPVDTAATTDTASAVITTGAVTWDPVAPLDRNQAWDHSTPTELTTTGGSGGPLTDQTFQTYLDAQGITSGYHLYAAGLDWSKPVGILIYTDGSAEYGLANPTDPYLLAGNRGMVAVAKRHNMILLTPMAPGAGCPDGDGVCWYETSSGYTPAMKAQWSRNLITYIYGRYNIDLRRVCFGGYSSGAQWATEFFGPAHASQIMNDGVAVAISYGGEPQVTATHTAAHKAAVPYVWDTGDRDAAWTGGGVFGVPAGKAWYDANGFTTQLHLLAGEDHFRDGQFGAVIDREITEHVPALGVTPSSIAPPVLQATYGPAGVITSTTSTTSVTVAAGDLLVITAGTQAESSTVSTPSGGGLTYTLRSSITGVTGYSNAYLWTAAATTAQTFTLTMTRGGTTTSHGYRIYRFSGHGGLGAAAQTNIASGAPSLNITTQAANSAIVMLNADWNAPGGTPTYRQITGTTFGEYLDVSNANVDLYGGVYPDTGAAGVKTIGMTAPTGQKYSIVALEIKAPPGLTYTAAPVDTAAATDVVTVNLVTPNTAAPVDTAAAVDTATTVRTVARTHTDTAGATDVGNAYFVKTAAVSDAAAATDSLTHRRSLQTVDTVAATDYAFVSAVDHLPGHVLLTSDGLHTADLAYTDDGVAVLDPDPGGTATLSTE
jgi:hypothetical protein